MQGRGGAEPGAGHLTRAGRDREIPSVLAAPIGRGRFRVSTRFDRLVVWAPRILGVLVCAFVGALSLDAFAPGVPFVRALPAFLINVAPAVLLLGAVVLSWWWEPVGAVVFTATAVGYAVMARRHPSWVVTVSGPLLLVGGLFVWGWVRRRGRRAS